MTNDFPKLLLESIADGSWKSPGAELLRRLLGEDLPEIKLFEDVAVMRRMPLVLDAGGFVDDPQFCFVRETRSTQKDPRLLLDDAIFIGGSTAPGEDVLIAIDTGVFDPDPVVLVLDWRCAIPNRWTPRCRLSELIGQLRRNQT
ncbi:hypothetical protein LOC68_15545 [Blastopirellula sp. JC732]|uniref:Uncharacterized protein n=1 Tax=Blastopirellula sediminis TaxID=2894196 RepID=A0A9X1SGW3_9BACT|nr:hypothetical protein [Blastopirellula sediminis]MCC9606901.1 hypothetical protein [Blastopirellula sediminis]MCC9629803.1 hypothetical protein [Blastopirellula sediminis]